MKEKEQVNGSLGGGVPEKISPEIKEISLNELEEEICKALKCKHIKIDKDAYKLLLRIKEKLKKENIDKPTFSNAIRYLYIRYVEVA